MSLASLLLQLLLIAFFVPAALLKLSGHPHMRKEFAHFGYPYALARFAGTIEIVACTLLILGFRWQALSAPGALLLVAVMIGASWINFHKRPVAFGWGTLVIMMLCASLVVLRLDAFLIAL